MKDLKTINKAIASIKTAGAKLDAMIQTTAVDVVEHFTAHKDTGLVNRLYLAMPKGARGVALADWMLKFMPLKVNTSKETKAEQPFVYDKERAAMLTEDNLKAAASVNWFDLKKEKALDEVFDVATAVRAMFRRIERSIKVEHFDHDALVVLAKSVGIPESDVPTKPGAKAKEQAAADAVGDAVM